MELDETHQKSEVIVRRHSKPQESIGKHRKESGTCRKCGKVVDCEKSAGTNNKSWDIPKEHRNILWKAQKIIGDCMKSQQGMRNGTKIW